MKKKLVAVLKTKHIKWAKRKQEITGRSVTKNSAEMRYGVSRTPPCIGKCRKNGIHSTI